MAPTASLRSAWARLGRATVLVLILAAPMAARAQDFGDIIVHDQIMKAYIKKHAAETRRINARRRAAAKRATAKRRAAKKTATAHRPKRRPHG